jgi:hypothetical protein
VERNHLEKRKEKKRERGWEDNIKINLREISCEKMRWSKITQDIPLMGDENKILGSITGNY